MEEVIKYLVTSLGLQETQIKEVLSMLAEGATIPFIARYRKDKTGNLNEDQIRVIEEQYKYQENLLNRKNVPTIYTLEKLCAALGVTMAQFFSIDDTRPNLTKEQEEFLEIFDEFSDEEKARVAAFMQGMRKVWLPVWKNTDSIIRIW